MNYKVQRRDIDTNKHVNNLIYLDYAYEALPSEIYENYNFSNIEIMYKHEAKLGDTLSLFYTNTEENEHIITIKNKENDIFPDFDFQGNHIGRAGTIGRGDPNHHSTP